MQLLSREKHWTSNGAGGWTWNVSEVIRVRVWVLASVLFYGTSVWQTQLTFNIFEIDKINYVNGTPLYHTVTTCSAALRRPGFRWGFVIHTKLTSITQECPLKSYLLRPEIERNRLEVCVQVLHPCFFHIFPARVEKKKAGRSLLHNRSHPEIEPATATSPCRCLSCCLL